MSDPVMRDRRDAVRREYAALAGRYEDRWARYVTATIARTVGHLAVRPGEVLLDLGCGTGALPRAVATGTPGTTVVGLDLSLPMLREARTRLGPRAPLLAADAADLPLAAASIDVVVSASSFHFWPDPMAGLREIRRVLRPGGRLVITDWCDDFLACKLCDRWLRLTRRAYHHIYGGRECAGMLARAGFVVDGLERYKVSWLWGMMTLTAAPESARTARCAAPPSRTG